ncbi:AraC family transcriptional regulator [Paenibacillus oceani]|uniref:Helix-turn-helix domain-containing protein n=1 Tax=Paenibacillus oceani TaxID=2772510 RepID=A0A927H3W8_9BACL|nr:AraC family transcriptional regulator [Paenibacillus oceani]MBD2866838.1 helix-turn-helix domain-containing protein [Paenibacillus oceani]
MNGYKEYPSEFMEMIYYTPSDLEKSIGVCPTNAGRMIAKPNYQAGPKMIVYYILEFVLEGQAVHWVNDQQIVYNKGDLFCIFPDISARWGLVAGNPNLRMSWFSIKGEGVKPLLAAIGITEDRPYLRNVFLPGLLGLLQQLVDEFRHLHAGENFFRWLAKMYELFDLLAVVARRERQALSEKGSPGWIQESVSFMQMYYTENITVQDVADYIGVHRSYFSAEFSKRQGIPPVQYLQRLRMEKGAQMLLETEFLITDIALFLGYPDLYTFTRAFRNYYNVTPSKLRTNPDVIIERENEPLGQIGRKREESLNLRLKPCPDSRESYLYKLFSKCSQEAD